MKKLFLYYAVVFIIFTLLFIFLLRSPLFGAMHVLFYRGFTIMMITAVIIGVMSVVFSRIRKIRTETLVASLVFSASLHLVFFVLFPVTFDRSVTMFLLNDADKNTENRICRGLPEEVLRNDLIESYVFSQGAVSRRMEEQMLSGNISGTKKCRYLTPQGKYFLRFSEIVSRIYGLK